MSIAVQGICKPHLFWGYDGKGLAISVLSSFTSLIPWARGRCCHWCLSQVWFVVFLCRCIDSQKPWVRKWSFRNKKALLSVTFRTSGRMVFPDKVGWRWEEWRLRVIKHHVCTYFLPTGTYSACQSHVLTSLLPSPQGMQCSLLNNSACGTSVGGAGKEECTDLNIFSNELIFICLFLNV